MLSNSLPELPPLPSTTDPLEPTLTSSFSFEVWKLTAEAASEGVPVSTQSAVLQVFIDEPLLFVSVVVASRLSSLPIKYALYPKDIFPLPLCVDAPSGNTAEHWAAIAIFVDTKKSKLVATNFRLCEFIFIISFILNSLA
jgi:hypothetical protein